MEIKNFTQLVETWGSIRLANDMQVSKWVVDKWRLHNSIPAKKWARLLIKARSRRVKVNAKMLIEWASEE